MAVWLKKSSPKSADIIFEVDGSYLLILTKDPDFNPIENLSNVIKSKLAEGTMKQNIFRGTSDAFSTTVKNTQDST